MSTYLRPVVCSTPRLTHSEVTTVGQKHNNNNNLARDGATWSGTSSALYHRSSLCVLCSALACRSTPRSTQSEGLFDVPVPTYSPGHKLRFFEFEDAVHDYYGFPITMDALPFCTCTLHVLYMYLAFAYMYLAFAYMYLAFAYMYFTCIGRIKSGRSHGVNPNPNEVRGR